MKYKVYYRYTRLLNAPIHEDTIEAPSIPKAKAMMKIRWKNAGISAARPYTIIKVDRMEETSDEKR